jgi:hypothetical protein
VGVNEAMLGGGGDFGIPVQWEGTRPRISGDGSAKSSEYLGLKGVWYWVFQFSRV